MHIIRRNSIGNSHTPQIDSISQRGAPPIKYVNAKYSSPVLKTTKLNPNNTTISKKGVIRALIDWIKGILKGIEFSKKDISDRKVKDAAHRLLNKITQRGDGMLLTFNGGTHSAILVNKGNNEFYYFSFGKCDYVIEANTLKKQYRYATKLEYQMNQFKDIFDNKDNIVIFKSLNVEKMLECWNNNNDGKYFKLTSHNCSHVAMKVLKEGTNPEATLKNENTTFNLPAHTMLSAKELINMYDQENQKYNWSSDRTKMHCTIVFGSQNQLNKLKLLNW